MRLQRETHTRPSYHCDIRTTRSRLYNVTIISNIPNYLFLSRERLILVLLSVECQYEMKMTSSRIFSDFLIVIFISFTCIYTIFALNVHIFDNSCYFSIIESLVSIFLSQNISLMASGMPDLLTAFHVELKNDVHIARKTLHELSNYKSHVSMNS